MAEWSGGVTVYGPGGCPVTADLGSGWSWSCEGIPGHSGDHAQTVTVWIKGIESEALITWPAVKPDAGRDEQP